MMSVLYATTGVVVGWFNWFLSSHVMPLVGGGHWSLLLLGDVLIAIGSIATARTKRVATHAIAFIVQVLGYSFTNSAALSLLVHLFNNQNGINRGNNSASHFALNQAINSCARIIGPLLFGFLYEFGVSSGYAICLPYLFSFYIAILSSLIPLYFISLT